MLPVKLCSWLRASCSHPILHLQPHNLINQGILEEEGEEEEEVVVVVVVLRDHLRPLAVAQSSSNPSP